jgi:hypothetical protein
MSNYFTVNPKTHNPYVSETVSLTQSNFDMLRQVNGEPLRKVRKQKDRYLSSNAMVKIVKHGDISITLATLILKACVSFLIRKLGRNTSQVLLQNSQVLRIASTVAK